MPITVWHFWHCDRDDGKRVAAAGGIDLSKAKDLPPLPGKPAPGAHRDAATCTSGKVEEPAPADAQQQNERIAAVRTRNIRTGNNAEEVRFRMPAIDWAQMFVFTISPLELFIRGTLIFLFLFCLFRFVVHRDVGGLGISDLLVLVIIADASQNAMAGGYKSIVDGFLLIGTIIGWSMLLNYLSFRFEFMRRVVLPRPLCLIKDGVKHERNLRREFISDEELAEMLREHEIEDISEVRRAYLEPDGQVTVFRKNKRSAKQGALPERQKGI